MRTVLHHPERAQGFPSPSLEQTSAISLRHGPQGRSRAFCKQETPSPVLEYDIGTRPEASACKPPSDTTFLKMVFNIISSCKLKSLPIRLYPTEVYRLIAVPSDLSCYMRNSLKRSTKVNLFLFLITRALRHEDGMKEWTH